MTVRSQADEALQRAVPDTDAIPHLIIAIAERLTREHPTRTATPADLDDLASETTWTHVKHRSHRGRVDRVRHGLLHRAVFGALLLPRPDETRGELALRLRDAANWPEDVIARYRTTQGFAVDVRPHPALADHILAGCDGCRLADHAATGNRDVDTERMRTWAQQHASTCLAVPLPA
ncbi:hypothetical protein ACIPY6_02985 [Streptomyces sp. NPDC090054]|uniref:hypothetical protein n=1 Tax=Streptomyces sp. NPDC090054 TaxID=3365933 RepID=UPI00381221C2